MARSALGDDMSEPVRLLELLEQRGERLVAAPLAPSSFEPRLQATDADETGGDEGEELLDVVGLALGIDYVDSAGTPSRRRITIRSLSSRGAVLLINAFCHEREAIRQFRCDRIEELVVLSTGEVIEDIPKFFDGLAGRDPTAEVLRGCRHALQILTFIGRCDEYLHPAEQAEIVDFIIFSAPTPAAIDEERVRRHVSALYPDKVSYYKSLRAIKFSGGEAIRQIVKTMRRVIDADGVFHDKEFEWALVAHQEFQ